MQWFFGGPVGAARISTLPQERGFRAEIQKDRRFAEESSHRSSGRKEALLFFNNFPQEDRSEPPYVGCYDKSGASVIRTLLQWIAIDVLIINVTCGSVAHRHEPLRAVRRHPDHIPFSDWMPFVVQAIDSLTAQHHQSVFHDMGFNEWQRRAGLIRKDVDGQVELRLIGQQHL